MPPGRLPLEVFQAPLGGGPRADPGLIGGIICPFWPGNTSRSPSLGIFPGPVASVIRPRISGRKWMNGWMDGHYRTLKMNDKDIGMHEHSFPCVGVIHLLWSVI